MEYERNHYVPEFLLRNWHSGTDNRLRLFQRHRGVLHCSPKPASAVCWSDNIYTTHDLADGARDASVERDFFTAHIDTPGAKVHQVLLSEGLKATDASQRGLWAQFLVAQYLRVPRTLRTLDAMAVPALDAQLQDLPVGLQIQMLGGETVDAVRWLQDVRSRADRKLARGGLPVFIQQGRLFDEMSAGFWDVRVIARNCPLTLLIGDHPLIVRGTRQDGYEVMLPLSPRAMFVKSPTVARRRELMGGSDEGFVKRANLETLKFASRYVVGCDNSQFRFIDRHLRLVPDT